MERALITRRVDGGLAIALWNYAEPAASGQALDFKVHLPFGRSADVTVLGPDQPSSTALWRTMGEPAFPSREQQQALREAAALPPTQSIPIIGGTIQLSLPVHTLALIEVEP